MLTNGRKTGTMNSNTFTATVEFTCPDGCCVHSQKFEGTFEACVAWTFCNFTPDARSAEIVNEDFDTVWFRFNP
jgi:hypothetical protein